MTRSQEFGHTIRRLREEKKITLRKFADSLEVSATYLSKIENGQDSLPSESRIQEIAKKLDADADWLLSLAGKVAPDLPKIIIEKPKEMAVFLRTAGKLSKSQLQEITETMQNKVTRGKKSDEG